MSRHGFNLPCRESIWAKFPDIKVKNRWLRSSLWEAEAILLTHPRVRGRMGMAMSKISETSKGQTEAGMLAGKRRGPQMTVLPYLHWQQAKFPSPFSDVEFLDLKEFRRRKNYLYKCRQLSPRAKMLLKSKLEKFPCE